MKQTQQSYLQLYNMGHLIKLKFKDGRTRSYDARKLSFKDYHDFTGKDEKSFELLTGRKPKHIFAEELIASEKVEIREEESLTKEQEMKEKELKSAQLRKDLSKKKSK